MTTVSEKKTQQETILIGHLRGMITTPVLPTWTPQKNTFNAVKVTATATRIARVIWSVAKERVEVSMDALEPLGQRWTTVNEPVTFTETPVAGTRRTQSGKRKTATVAGTRGLECIYRNLDGVTLNIMDAWHHSVSSIVSGRIGSDRIGSVCGWCMSDAPRAWYLEKKK